MHTLTSDSLPGGFGLREALLRSVAAGALALAAAAPAVAEPDACVGVGGPNVTCTGDQSDGVALGPPGEVFNVNSLTTDIAPNINIPGIFIFRIGGDMTLNSATGPFLINASGGAGFGISVRNFGAGLNIINQSGDITSEGVGLDSESLDAASVINVNATGNITADDDAIDVLAGGNVSVISTGNLVSTSACGISAGSTSGSVTISSGGAIRASCVGIDAISELGVSVLSTGDIVAETGVLAASISGAVEVAASGNIVTSGPGIVALAAQNVSVLVEGNVQAGAAALVAVDVGGDIVITVAPNGVVRGGTDGFAGVLIGGGGANMLDNYGSLSSLNGTAIIAGMGDEDVRNSGILTGNIELGAGTNALTNFGPGLFLPGSSINVGADNTVSNLGILSPGNIGAIQTTAITGNLSQGTSGRLVLDINPATGENDRINVSGTNTLAGSVVPNLLDTALLYKQFLIVSTAGTLTFDGLAVTDDSAAYDYSLTAIGNDLFLNIELVSIPGLIVGPLTPNQRATVQYLNRLLLSGPGPGLAAFLESIVALPSAAAIIAALDRLHPEAYLAAVTTTMQSSQLFFDSLMSCPSASAPGAVSRDAQCFWAQVQGRTSDWDRTSRNIGGSEDVGGVEGGLQAFVAPDWLLGGAISYEHSSIDTNNPASLEGDRAQAGLVTKGIFGDTTLAAALFGGFGWFDASRPIGLPAPGVTAEGEQDIGFGGAGLRISHVLDRGGWYLKPMADATVTYISYGDFAESGAEAANLIARGEQDMVIHFGAALEVGSVVVLDDGLLARPFLRLGVSRASQSDFSLTSSFAGAPLGIAPFTVTAHGDDAFAEVTTGIDLFGASGLSVNLAYDGLFGDHTASHAATARLRMAF